MYIYQIMSNNFGYLDIILLAMIAGFIILRLRNILGRKTGHEDKIYSDFSGSKLDEFKEEHPELERYFGNQATSATYGKPKSSDGFKEVMSKVQEAHPLANLSRFT